MSWKWENFCLEGEVWLLSGDSETIWGHLSSCFRLPGDSHAWSRLNAILPTWRYVTNCFPNVLPRRLFRLVAGQINSLSPRRAPAAALPLDGRGWQLITAREFCFSSSFTVLTGMDVLVRRGRQTMTNPERWISSDLSGPLCILFTCSPFSFLSLAFNKRWRTMVE